MTRPRLMDVENREDRSFLIEFLADAPVGFIERLEGGDILIKGEDGVYRYDMQRRQCRCPAGMRGFKCWHAAHIWKELSGSDLTDEQLVELYG